MTRPFSAALKQKLIARLTGVNAVSAAQLSRETGIKQQNLSRWLSEARNLPQGISGNSPAPRWTVDEKARILAQAAALRSEDLTQYLAGEGVSIAHFRRWRLALEEAGEECVSLSKRIGKLQRELIRKERALAEAAALLMLREPIENLIHREDGDGDEGTLDEEEVTDASVLELQR